ncbi:MAG: peptidase S1 [Anaerolineae bacterium]|nr:trypsin-like peptidase domain-containing protein [Anaerolineales bacterium]MCQ3978265.1 peptidase S1 [Anaerolineae bacterium]
MSEPSAVSKERWRQRWQRLRLYIRRAAPFVSGVLAALTALLLYHILFPDPPPLTTREVNNTITEALASATPPPSFSAQVYQAIRPSLVFIETEVERKNGETDNGLGSGVVINEQGDILTSLHVVADASDIKLIFADGTESTGQIIATQPENDIAVLSANPPPGVLVPAILGNPRAMRVGDEAYAVGHPLGLYGSMSAGVISGFDRSFTPPNSKQKLQGLIQIDAAVNPGNSGGPLLNRQGHVIGIVAALVNPTEQDVFIGIGFAVPINVAAAAAGSPPY